MSITKMPNGRFRARLKSGRVGVASKVFDTRREAKAWLDCERAALAGGVDPRAGRERVPSLVERWLEIRRMTIAAKTYRATETYRASCPRGCSRSMFRRCLAGRSPAPSSLSSQQGWPRAR